METQALCGFTSHIDQCVRTAHQWPVCSGLAVFYYCIILLFFYSATSFIFLSLHVPDLITALNLAMLN